MITSRLVKADFRLGRALITGKALLDITRMLLLTPSRESIELARLIMRVKPRYTMVTNAHLLNLYRTVREANALGIPGDLVECGVWNGGSAAVMSAACRHDQQWFTSRKLWLYDSFEGLPEPDERDGKVARQSYWQGWCKGSMDSVHEIFAKLGLPLEGVTVVPGWFDVTLPSAGAKEIAVLHIDADWYASVRLVLEALYGRVAPRGFVVLDDYGHWPGCQEAVHDFFKECEISDIEIEEIDGQGAFFQKPSTGDQRG